MIRRSGHRQRFHCCWRRVCCVDLSRQTISVCDLPRDFGSIVVSDGVILFAGIGEHSGDGRAALRQRSQSRIARTETNHQDPQLLPEGRCTQSRAQTYKPPGYAASLAKPTDGCGCWQMQVRADASADGEGALRDPRPEIDGRRNSTRARSADRRPKSPGDLRRWPTATACCYGLPSGYASLS